MKQNKKTTTLIGYLLTICTMIAALLIGWNHMNEIAQRPKSKEEIGYYQWDKKIAKIIPWWKGQAEPVYTIPSKSGCKMVFIDPDHDMMQIVFWKVKDRIKITKYYTDFNNYDFTLTDSRTNKERKISSKEAMRYAKLQQIKKEAKNVKQKYNISGDSKDKVAYVDFDIMTVGGKEYVGKEEEW